MKLTPFFAELPRRMVVASVMVACATASSLSFAQSWPAKPIRIVVGFPPGGVADIMARSVSQYMTESLGQPVVIENRAGANGNIAADAVAKSAADGYTIGLVSTGIESVNPAMFPRMAYDPHKDLQHVGATGRIQLFLTTRVTLDPNDVKSFVSTAKSRKPALSFGSAGPGSTPHLVAELFKRSAGFEAVHVPYRGAAPALTDLMAGSVDFFFDPGISFSSVRAGKVKMLAVASAKRSELFPDVPTLLELGYKGVDYDTWFGIYAPTGVPADILTKLNQALNKALSQETVRTRFRDLGGEATPMSAAEFKAIAARETSVFSPLVRELGIKAD